jgi:hypothetical protein
MDSSGTDKHDSIKKLIQARSTLAQSTDTAIVISDNLVGQKNQLMNIQKNTKQVDENISLSRRIMYRMKKYESRYIIMYISAILILLILIAILSYVIYKKYSS